MKQKIKVWDLPTRLFHWSLLPLIVFMWFSAKQGGDWLPWHLRAGLLLLGLLVFRLCWGVWGSDTAQFRQFVKPSQIPRYLQGKLSENEQAGHNPLGALMVVALILALLMQVGTGLFASDENTFLYNGYLNQLVDSEIGGKIRMVHMRFFNILLLLVAVHIMTVLIYKFVKKHDLIKPMITGYKELTGTLPILKFAGFGKFLVALIVAIAAVMMIAL